MGLTSFFSFLRRDVEDGVIQVRYPTCNSVIT